MKRIEGVIVVGAPYSVIRYTEAHSLCVECLKACPVPIISGTMLRNIFHFKPSYMQCYVCERFTPSYKLE